jgi:translation initiation factor IF-1
MNSEKRFVLEGTIMMVLRIDVRVAACAIERMVLALHFRDRCANVHSALPLVIEWNMEMSPYDTAKARIVYRL